MARLRFTQPFLEELSALDMRVEDEVWRKLALIEAFPGAGSSLVEPSLTKAFGQSCLKINALGYDVIYERLGTDDERRGNGSGSDEADEIVAILGIVPQRKVR